MDGREPSDSSSLAALPTADPDLDAQVSNEQDDALGADVTSTIWALQPRPANIGEDVRETPRPRPGANTDDDAPLGASDEF